jgi:hypothetical protein
VARHDPAVWAAVPLLSPAGVDLGAAGEPGGVGPAAAGEPGPVQARVPLLTLAG